MTLTYAWWTYAAPAAALIAITWIGLILVTREPAVRRPAPRHVRPTPPLPGLTSQQFVTNAQTLFRPAPVEHEGATLVPSSTLGDAAAVPAHAATLDPAGPTPEEWLAAWTTDYRSQRARELAETSDVDLALVLTPDDVIWVRLDRATDAFRASYDRATRRWLDAVEDGSARLGHAELDRWRAETDTTEIPAIRLPDAPAALAESLLVS